jgi:hypothetical protein
MGTGTVSFIIYGLGEESKGRQIDEVLFNHLLLVHLSGFFKELFVPEFK